MSNLREQIKAYFHKMEYELSFEEEDIESVIDVVVDCLNHFKPEIPSNLKTPYLDNTIKDLKLFEDALESNGEKMLQEFKSIKAALAELEATKARVKELAEENNKLKSENKKLSSWYSISGLKRR